MSLRDATARCLAAKTDLEIQDAWVALTEALDHVDDEERRRVLGELADDAVHPILLEFLAAEASRSHDYEAVVELTNRALENSPGKRSLLLGLETAHLQLGNDAAAAAVARALKSAPVPLPTNEAEAIQRKIDTMHRLVNAAFAMFSSQKSVAELVETLERAAGLEQELLVYWRNGSELARGRGELTASGMYIAALRQSGEYEAAADWFRQITEDRDLLEQCLRDFRTSGENTLNNGVGALIDTRSREDLDYGGELLDFLDAHPPFVTAMLPLACCCLATQRGEHERALGYLRTAVELGRGKTLLSDGGSDICAMAWSDEDLAPLQRLPEFVEIVGERR